MSVFDFFKKSGPSTETTKQASRRPKTRDMSESFSANRDLTVGLYKNSYPGMKLAGGLAFPAITIPVYFMGFPSVKSESETTQEMGNSLVSSMLTTIQQIHISCHREGTIWVWPRFDSELMELVWEFLLDDSISDVIRDVRTGRIKAVLTDEEITVTTAREKTQVVRRQRTFTPLQITETYTGGTIEGLENSVSDNPLGIMPIPFTNNLEPGDVRGSSDLGRPIPLLKSYHDLSVAEFEILAQFRPKMIQNLKSQLADWLKNNGFDSIADVDINAIDFIVNLEDESTEFVKPGEVTEGYREAKRQLFKQIVQTSGIPEIAWGLKTEGNNASVEESMGVLVNFASDKQRQKNDSYKKLIEASLRIIGAVNSESMSGDIEINWNDIDVVSQKTKAEIFKNFAQGVKFIMDSAGGTMEQMFNVWKSMYPGIGPQTVEDFKKGVKDTATVYQFKSANYLEALDASGGLDL